MGMTPTLPMIPAPALPNVVSVQQAGDAAQALQQHLASLPAPTIAPVSLGAPSLPPISAPILPSVVKGNVPSSPNSGDSQIYRDQNALLAARNAPAGGSQLHNPFLRGVAQTADVLASVFAPRIATIVPGTTLHHNMLVGQAQQNLANDQAYQQKDAQIQQQQALARQESARADAFENPQRAIDPSKTVTTDDGVYQLNPNTGKYDIRVGDRIEKPKPIEEQAYEYALGQGKNPLDAYNAVYNAKNQKSDSLPQQYLDALASGDQTKADLIKRTIQATQVQPKIDVHAATAREPQGPKQMVYVPQPDGSTKAIEVTPGMTIPTGATKTPGGEKISADEQKRADLAQNMNENIDALEDILTRRPELFGPVAGRLTEAKAAFGSNDPDVAKLMTIEHQLGMVAQGAHGMRSAQGVQSAAQSLTNGFKNSPDATKAALEAARASVRTFLSNSQNPGQPRAEAVAPPVGADVKVTGADGKLYWGNSKTKQILGPAQ